ncbi:MAG TPA: two-component regulator propeller domain-containing protein, partial [Thermoanaerobaculia bacterium]|nr:two-component regulator propeller domain-containing protein [Thermoanaerobaculia bacterium]
MRKTNRWILSLLVLAIAPTDSFAIDPRAALDQNVVQTWGVDQGLPQGTVYSVAQTSDGYVWAATQEGFVRFDGANFTVFDKAAAPEVRNNYTAGLLAARDGSLYAATRGGLVRVEGQHVRSWSVKDGLPTDAVTSLYQSSDGTIWIGTQKGLARLLNDGRIAVAATPEMLPHPLVTAMTEDWSGQLWIGTRQGIATYKDGRVSRHDTDGFPTEQILALSSTRDGSVWIGTQGYGLLRYRSGRFRIYTAKDGFPSKNASAVYEDRRGTLWLGTYDAGIGRFENERFEFNLPQVGIGKNVTAFVEDREGNLWVAFNGGLTRIAEGKVLAFTTAQGLLSDSVRSVHSDPSGTLWVGTGRGLQTLDGAHTLTKASGLSSDIVLSAWSGRDGSIWVGTADGGLNHVVNRQNTVYNVANGLKANMILSGYEDRSGTVWVGTSRGVNRIVGGKIAPDKLRIGGEMIAAFLEDRNGALWIGTQDGGVNRIDPNGFVRTFTTRNGLSSDFVLALYQDNTGAMWIGTAGGGLNRFKNGRWSTISARDGLVDDSVFAILEDSTGYFWMSCNKGIFRVSRRQLDDFSEGVVHQVSGVLYGRADGMKSRECNGGTQPVGWKTADGRLWFATVKGLAMIDPAKAHTVAPPPVTIEGVFADRTRIDPSNPQLLAPGTKGVEFHYAGMNFAAPAKVHYQYKLEGFDKEWIDAGTRRVANYTNLPPGTYQFRVRAAVDDGPWNTTTTTFRQRPYFYQTPWFLGAAVVSLLGLAGRAHRSRVNLVRASAERFKNLFERSPAGEYRATVEGRILDCNEACAKILGLSSRDDLMTRGIAEFFWNDAERQTMFTRLRGQGSLVNFEASLRRADGTQIWVLMNVSLVVDGQEQPVIEATLVDITDRKRAEEEVRYRAHHDVLTGLPNRALFKDRLTIALNYAHRAGNQVAVLCLDLDSFNVVNEAFGREGGDHLLKEVATRLKSCVREEDSVARVGDDEFTLMIMKPANVGDVTAVARKILQTIAEPMTVDGNQFNITTSIGIAFYPQDGGDAESLLKNADSALYQSKEAGRNSYQLCSPFLARKAAERLTLETALHQALDRHEFVLHYQPQLDLRKQAVVGMEALIRWDRGGKNMLRPNEFISVAEDTRLILPIGEWAIEEACRQGAAWATEGVPMKVAVNVSPRQFQQPNFVS